jgi:glucokinase
VPESRDMRDEVAIGIDVGGTKVAIGLVAGTGRVLASERLDVKAAESFESLLASIAERARAAQEASSITRAAGVGVGMPELVDRDGHVRTHCTFPWTTAQLEEALAPLGRVVVLPDVRAAALAEARLGAGREWDSFVYLSIGTGISHALVDRGQPRVGARGAAQLIGSARVYTPCGDAERLRLAPALEEYASGPAIAQRFSERAGRSVTQAEEVFEAAAAGDAVAEDLVRSSAEAVGSWAGLLVNVFDPDGVILGGGLGLASGPYGTTLEAVMRRTIWAPQAKSMPIRPARFHAQAGLVGAALAALGEADDKSVS